ncbi:hypothetical protein [Roseateles sp.]|jgi:hypothetical protein|uniref:hypothetical protein n=1 Tax=Roseateles sp. TaxID=1971397 RepID=UPI00393787DB
MNACTQNCRQGRDCSCAPSPAVIKTRPSLAARLRRWWALRQLREELAGLDAEHAAVFDEISDLMAAQFLPGEDTAAKLAQATLQMRRLELLDITQRRVALLARIHAAEARA